MGENCLKQHLKDYAALHTMELTCVNQVYGGKFMAKDGINSINI